LIYQPKFQLSLLISIPAESYILSPYY